MIKKNIKVVAMFILGVVCAVGITFAYSVSSKNVLVKHTGWNVKNAEEALDYLKDKTKCSGIQIKKIGELKAVAHDKTPALYEIDPGDGVKRNFYVLQDKGDAYDLIMDRNLSSNSELVSYNSALTYLQENGYKTSWKNVVDVKLPTANQIAAAGDIPDFDATGRSYSRYSFFGVDSSSDSSKRSSYTWLYDYLNGCSNASCSNDPGTGRNGYWTSDECYDYTSRAWMVYYPGRLTNDPKSGSYGVRPVITVNKENL